MCYHDDWGSKIEVGLWKSVKMWIRNKLRMSHKQTTLPRGKAIAHSNR